ncbi:MAG: putative toxin-antitoxin system toxin component, PIN family [Alphaproteobacteria bacterium]|jgi:putative PIN family toxin of toxin-antitoxin system|nr:putative toxin-antitoxin system toxin component, PIN family [Alphaproteobacteria bacterium]
MVRLTLDTDVVVAALRSPSGAFAGLLRMIDEGQAVMLLSVPLLLEYEAVCTLSKHRSASGLSSSEVESFIDWIAAMSEEVSILYQWRPQLRDADDEMVLETAVNGQADMLVTFNAKDFGNAPGLFGIGVSSPAAALRRVRQ